MKIQAISLLLIISCVYTIQTSYKKQTTLITGRGGNRKVLRTRSQGKMGALLRVKGDGYVSGKLGLAGAFGNKKGVYAISGQGVAGGRVVDSSTTGLLSGSADNQGMMSTDGFSAGQGVSTGYDMGSDLSMSGYGMGATSSNLGQTTKTVVAQRLISQPIITRRIIQQPIIRRRVVKKKLIRSTQNMTPRVVNRNVNRMVNVNLPSNEVNNLLVVQPAVHTNNVNVRFNKLPSRNITRNVVVEPLRRRNRSFTRNVNLAGNQVYNHRINRPSMLTVNENVRFVRGQDRKNNFPSISRNIRITRRQKNRLIRAEGDLINNYTILKPMRRVENVSIDYNKQPTTTKTNQLIVEPTKKNIIRRQRTLNVEGNRTIIQPIVQNIVRNRVLHHITKPLFKKIEVIKTVKVPINMIQRVPIVKRINVPINTKGNINVVKGQEQWDMRYKGEAMGPGSQNFMANTNKLDSNFTTEDKLLQGSNLDYTNVNNQFDNNRLSSESSESQEDAQLADSSSFTNLDNINVQDNSGLKQQVLIGSSN